MDPPVLATPGPETPVNNKLNVSKLTALSAHSPAASGAPVFEKALVVLTRLLQA
jgi:hypothetical protein